MWSVRWQWSSFPAWKVTTERNDFPFPDDPLEVLVFGTCLPNELLKLRLIPIDLSSIQTFLNLTSNGEVVHLGKMSLYGLLPVFSHNQSGSAQSDLAGHTKNPEGVSELQQWTNPALAMDLLIRDNGATRTTFRTTPPKYCQTSLTTGWRKSEPIRKPYPVPYGGFVT